MGRILNGRRKCKPHEVGQKFALKVFMVAASYESNGWTTRFERTKAKNDTYIATWWNKSYINQCYKVYYNTV